jgi:hypothetical protein
MRAKPLYFFLFITLFALVRAQDETILPAQAEAIRTLANERGFTEKMLNEYIITHYGVPLVQLSKSKAADVITVFQSPNPPSPPAEMTQQTPARIPPKTSQKLLLAGNLEIGMSKLFHLVDGNIIQGTITAIGEGICSIETQDGILQVPSTDILEETAEVTKRDGSRYVGPVLKESSEEITVRSKYGDATINKRDVQDMNRYHGGQLVPWAEEKKRFYRSQVVLTDIFVDPTAFPLETNALYISGLSLGYGFTDYFMVKTAFGNNFTGDLNLEPLYQFYSQRQAGSSVAAALGFDLYSHHDMSPVVAKYAQYIQRNDTLIQDINNVSVSDVIAKKYQKTFYAEAYVVFSQRWSLETGRGEMGYHVGFRTTSMIFQRSNILKDEYQWSGDQTGKFPFRFWVAFEYDLTKNLKLAMNAWADNGYRYRTLQQVKNDYFSDNTAFVLDSKSGEYRTIDFDFGLLYAANESLRLGIHFKEPYIVLFWRIVEF